MNKKKGSLKKIGMLCMSIGILALVLGILMLMFASFGGLWVIICSIILNIIGINLMIYKPQE